MESRFSVGTVLNRTFEVYFRNIPNLLIIGLVPYLPFNLIQSALITNSSNPDSGAGILFSLLTLPIMIMFIFLMQGAVVHGVYENLNLRPFRLGASVGMAMRRVGYLILASIVAGFLTTLGYFVLIVPGVMIYCALFVVVPAVVVEKAGVGQALSRSQELTRGYRMRIFGLVVVLGLISFVASLLVMFLGAAITAALESVWVSSIFTAVLQALSGTLGAVAATVCYYHLRMDVEGVDLNQLVSVFD